MDGLSSARTSASIISDPNHGSGTPLTSTPRQSIRELFSAKPTIVIDPPRPAREGCEWVWYPAGYWAEREIVELPPKESIKVFKWRKRSRKSGSESSKHSPQTSPSAHSVPESRKERSTDHLAGRQSQTRSPTSSESGGLYYPLNRMPDAPLPSPYLTEEAHVQSLQWPSIDAVSRHGSLSGSSVIRSKSAIPSSPLQFSSAEDEVGSDMTVAYTPNSQANPDNSTEIASMGKLSPKAVAGQEVKPKKSFISWRMLSEHRQASSDESLGDDMAHIQPPRPQSPAKSPLRKESTLSDKSRKSRKSRSSRLFTKARWSRKFSSSSGASTSRSTASSVHNSIRSQSPVGTPGSEGGGEVSIISNAWASEYPGGEAMRVQTPRIVQNSLDHFPRSFFSDLTPPPSSPPPTHRPLSRQEGQLNLNKKTTLSTSFTPGGDSSASSTTPRVLRTAPLDGEDIHDSDKSLTPRSGTTRRGRPIKPKEKQWWEVSVPVSYSQVGQRAAFRFDLPEHLPSSPMCPANKRHKSGGTGVCVYHGRAKRVKKTSPNNLSGDRYSPKGGSRDEEGFEDSEDVDDGDDDAGSDVWK
ncbi:hypothetical protein FHL15_002098 [Xylaria flabelliformis]|uniref:Uncharacterized protein n=1 Tax=Xylaria flabelliformis TaxID=2512241 RepID=A0A553I9D9_9PEZI|nr:hypothetical protein FHL15_002098 [Xylaria flabelliformis]